MRRAAAIGIWVLVAAYGVSLVAAVDATLDAQRLAEGTPILLAPLEGDPSRAVETRGPGVRVRRLCASGRCELLVGREGGGYALMASYPADRWVALDHRDGALEIREIGASRPTVEAELSPRWILTAVLGALLAGLLIGRGRRLRAHLARITRARPAVVVDGGLAFLDAAHPRCAIPCDPLPDGPATGLEEVWPERGGEAPYRDAQAARWAACAGARDALLARAASHLGAHAICGRVALVGTAVALGALFALS